MLLAKSSDLTGVGDVANPDSLDHFLREAAEQTDALLVPHLQQQGGGHGVFRLFVPDLPAEFRILGVNRQTPECRTGLTFQVGAQDDGALVGTHAGCGIEGSAEVLPALVISVSFDGRDDEAGLARNLKRPRRIDQFATAASHLVGESGECMERRIAGPGHNLHGKLHTQQPCHFFRFGTASLTRADLAPKTAARKRCSVWASENVGYNPP